MASYHAPQEWGERVQWLAETLHGRSSCCSEPGLPVGGEWALPGFGLLASAMTFRIFTFQPMGLKPSPSGEIFRFYRSKTINSRLKGSRESVLFGGLIPSRLLRTVQ